MTHSTPTSESECYSPLEAYEIVHRYMRTHYLKLPSDEREELASEMFLEWANRSTPFKKNVRLKFLYVDVMRKREPELVARSGIYAKFVSLDNTWGEKENETFHDLISTEHVLHVPTHYGKRPSRKKENVPCRRHHIYLTGLHMRAGTFYYALYKRYRIDMDKFAYNSGFVYSKKPNDFYLCL